MRSHGGFEMDIQHQPTLQRLTREECLQLLRDHTSYGRVGYVVDGQAIIVPINFVIDGESVVFASLEGSKLGWLGLRSRIAFQVDQGNPAERTGWSVLVHGTAGRVTDPAELDGLRQGPMRSWAVASAEHWVRLSIDEISGRRLASGPPAAGRDD